MKFLQAVATLVLRARPETGGFHFQNLPLTVVIASEVTQSHEQKAACLTDRHAFFT